MRRNSAKNVAIGGVFAALAVVVMSLGTLIPAATFACPMVCMVILSAVNWLTGKRIAWAWFGAVAILSLLLSPDKEAAIFFLFLGYYPIFKPWLDRRRLAVLWKFLFFNAALLLMYAVMIHILGMDAVVEEFEELGTVMTMATLLIGDLSLLLLDVYLRLLEKKWNKKRR